MPRATRRSVHSRAVRVVDHVGSSTDRRTRSGQHPAMLPPFKPSTTRQAPKPSALAFLSRSQDEINADPNKQVRIFALPRELLQQIAHNLPLVSIICLTLTCKEAAEAIGTESWARYKKEKQWLMDRDEFYDLLARDWGDILEFCPRCDTLHPPLHPPRSHRGTKLTKRCFGQDAMIDYLPQDTSNGYNPLFIHIANAMEESRDSASKGDFGQLIDTLSGDFTVTRHGVSWGLTSSAQRVDGNLILQHTHTFRSETGRRLRNTDLLALPIRLCPHQSTTTVIPQRSLHINGKSAEMNGRLLTKVITSAFPLVMQKLADMKSLKHLTPSEEAQMLAAQNKDNVIWCCRSCPTKYQVEHSQDRVSIKTWHSFGRDTYHASKYWKWLVRRTGTTLGTDKRNDEWWSPSRTVPDFMCELK